MSANPSAAQAQLADSPAQPPYASTATIVFSIGILMLITLNSLLDRFLPSLFLGPIRETLAISDTQISLIQGYAFALFFVLFSLPFGRLVDRTNRRNLIIGGLIFWSATTVLSAFAGNFWQLFVARAGVGIGEACLHPAAYSLIADYVKPQYRGRALAIYSMSFTCGAGLSLILGATVLNALPSSGQVFIAGYGFETWQIVFLVAGLAGLAIAPLMLLIREAPRRNHRGLHSAGERSTLREVGRHVGQHRAAFTFTFAAYVLTGFAGLCVTSWAPTYLARRFELPLTSVGLLGGAAMIVGGIAGALICGYLSDRWSIRGATGTRLRVVIAASAIFVPAIALWPFADTVTEACVLWGVLALAATLGTGSSSSTLQDMAPNRMRGQIVGSFIVISGLTGLGLGPTAVALVTDHVFHDDSMVGYSMALVALPASVIAALCSYLGLRPYDRVRNTLL